MTVFDNGALALHFQIDGFRLLYGSVTAFLWLITSIFSPGYFAKTNQSKDKINRYWLFNLLTFGATLGVFFSADFRTTFLFFELMSLASYPLVAHDETPQALRAAETYLIIAIMGGLSILAGMLFLYMQLGTLEFAGLYEICKGMEDRSPLYLPGILMLIGFGAKAGMFPLHIWLPKAHPVAPAPASALLSGILIKTGVFGVIVLSSNVFFNDHTWGLMLLLPAAITMVLGALMAIFSTDLKHTLACSSVSQMGFILTGVAMQVFLAGNSSLASRGVLLHMLNHSLLKLLLFTIAGVVYMNRKKLHLNEIRGFGRGKKLFTFVFLTAALSISGIPLFSGYISKTLLHEGIVEAVYLYQNLSLENFLVLIDIAFIFTGGLTITYMVKLIFVLFTGQNENAEKEKSYMGTFQAIALAASAILVLVLGLVPIFMDKLANIGQSFFQGQPLKVPVYYFSQKNLQSVLNSLLIGAVVIIFVIHNFLARKPELPKWLDLEDTIYRPLLKLFFQLAYFFLVKTILALNALMKLLFNFAFFIIRITAALPAAPLRQPSWEEPASIGGFSLGLLLAGAGLCVALIYVFIQAF